MQKKRLQLFLWQAAYLSLFNGYADPIYGSFLVKELSEYFGDVGDNDHVLLGLTLRGNADPLGFYILFFAIDFKQLSWWNAASGINDT